MAHLFDLHADWLRAAGTSETTIRDRLRLLDYADRHLPRGVNHAHTTELARLFSNRTWSAWTRNVYWRHLNRYYVWAVDAGELDLNPMRALRRPPEGERLPNPVDTDTLERLLERVSADPRWHQPWRLAILLAAYGGLRVGDIAALCREDVTAERMRIRNGKGGRDAYVVTHPLVWADLKDLPAGPVTRDTTGRPVTGYALTNRAWHVFRALGFPGLHMHMLRHWHATALLEAGADLETVRQCMRHRSIVSTVGYTRIVSARRAAAVHALPVVGHEPDGSRLVPPAAEAA